MRKNFHLIINDCELINNVLYDAIDGKENNIWHRNGNAFENGDFILESISFGNSNNDLNS